MAAIYTIGHSNVLDCWYLEKAISDPFDGIQIRVKSVKAPQFGVDRSG